MCGIFGVISAAEEIKSEQVQNWSKQLFKLSESRGKEASGWTLMRNGSEAMGLIKSPLPASDMIKSDEFRNFRDSFLLNRESFSGAAFGHTRLVTNGSQSEKDNNQPVMSHSNVIVHNGIVVNVEEIWKKFPQLQKRTDVDSEAIVALIGMFLEEGLDPLSAAKKAFAEIRGTASIALALTQTNQLILATNNGSLYLLKPTDGKGPWFFASEFLTLHSFLQKSGLEESKYAIVPVEAGEGWFFDFTKGVQRNFSLKDQGLQKSSADKALMHRNVEVKYVAGNNNARSLFALPSKLELPEVLKKFRAAEMKINKIRRCTQCIMPETVPFIEFNEQGVCNFCSNYKKIVYIGRDQLDKDVEKFREANGKPGVVLALSGGRDSCYGLHYAVKELGLKPVTYTYDWGLVTDLARRNISRVCSQLGVENIIISADILWKRENVRKNIEAWLKKPHLGMIPLFMAGDKEFMSLAREIRMRMGIKGEIFSFNLLEKTQFKEEMTGIQFWKPGADSDKFGEQLAMLNRAKLAGFYAKEFLTNPGYLNRSLWDTFVGFWSYYFVPQEFVPLFRYIEWKEDEVVGTLLKEYDWEVSNDTKSTWRIGDGTAAFYNYIYYVVAGFTENDTFRSNQIREGHLTREEALRLTERDNQPRWETLHWYSQVVGFDLERALHRIHEIPQMYDRGIVRA